MKLTEQDKKWLREFGYDDKDFPQIEEAAQRRKTVYKLGRQPISREQAIALLGRKTYLSGLSRSAFHCTAVRDVDDGRFVYFDSSNLFRD